MDYNKVLSSIDNIDYEINNLNIKIIYKEIICKIHLPKTSSEYLIVEEDNNYKLPWIDNLNIQTIQKNYTIEDIINYIIQKINQGKYEKKNIDDNIFLDNFEYDIITLKNNLNSLESKVSEKSILINEYINIHKKIKSNDIKYIEIKTKDTLDNWTVINTFPSLNYLKVEYDLYFNELYPYYPPTMKIISPKLSPFLMKKLPSLRLLQLEYWSPVRTNEYIINKIYNILKDNIKLEDLNKINNNITKLELKIMELASLVDLEEKDLDTTYYPKFNLNKKTIDKGIGYGHCGTNIWNFDKYLTSKKERDDKVNSILLEMNDLIHFTCFDNRKEFENIIENSLLIEYFKYELNGINLLEIDTNNLKYTYIFSIIHTFISLEMSFIFFTGDNSVYKQIVKLNDSINNIFKIIQTNNINMDLINIIMTITNYLTADYIVYENSLNNVNNDSKEIIEIDNKEKYKKELRDETFKIVNIFDNHYIYKEEFERDSKVDNIKYQKRIISELNSLQQNLPLDYNSSIFLRADENNLNIMSILVTGPPDTPYEDGVFMFDIYIPTDYPNSPPLMKMKNTNGFRFNPNLYEDGKICLSIINTWSGDKSERWNPTSTLYQVFMSISSLVLVDNPFYNEPGYTKHQTKTDSEWNKDSYDYNQKVMYYNIIGAMLNVINNINTYSNFKEVIIKHFKIKKDNIINNFNKKINNLPDNYRIKHNNKIITKNDIIPLVTELKKVIEKL